MTPEEMARAYDQKYGKDDFRRQYERGVPGDSGGVSAHGSIFAPGHPLSGVVFPPLGPKGDVNGPQK